MLAKHALSDEHAGAVVASWISKWPKWPRPSDIKQFCDITADPRMAEAAKTRGECQRCDGAGWISVQGPHGTSAAYHCSHQPETESDRRMGVSIHPALAAQYRQLDIEAEGRKAVCEGNGGKHSVDDFKRANTRTVAGIAAGRF